MRIVCKCGHKVTVQDTHRPTEFWEDYAKKCLCADCYEKKTGRVCNEDTVMVSDLWVMN
jgi:hypothetical protein